MQIPDPLPCRLDDDGFLVLVDPTAYAGFVDEEWTMDTLQAHVVDQAGRGRITGAHLGPFLQGLPAEVRSDRSVRPSTREAVAGVEVQGDGLYVVDYTALTMAAQFSDRDVVQDHRASDRVLLPAGWYRVTFRQLRDEADVDQPGFWESDEVALEVVVEPAGGRVEPAAGGFAWFGV